MLFERTVVYTLLFAFLSWGKLGFRQKLKKFALLSTISLCSAAIFKSTCVHPAHAWQPYCMEFLAMGLPRHQDSSHKKTSCLPKSYCTCKLRHVWLRHVSSQATLWVDWHVNSTRCPSCIPEQGRLFHVHYWTNTSDAWIIFPNMWVL